MTPPLPHPLCLGATVLILAACAGSGAPGTQPPAQPPPTPEPAMTAPTTGDPDQLAVSLTALASSADAEALGRLRQSLTSPEVLLRLNTEAEYGKLKPLNLRAARVLKALSANPAAAAGATLDALATSPAFLSEETRQDLLLRSVTLLRPAPAGVVKFFESQSRPEATNLHLAIDCIVANGSEPAIRVLERVLASTEQEPENKIVWMRDPVLRHRCDAPLLEACERLLTGRALAPNLKTSLVESLFDYKREWYPPDSDRPKPPEFKAANEKARAALVRIGAWADKEPSLPDRLRAKVHAAADSLR